MGMSEPGAGTDVLSMRTSAKKTEDGERESERGGARERRTDSSNLVRSARAAASEVGCTSSSFAASASPHTTENKDRKRASIF